MDVRVPPGSAFALSWWVESQAHPNILDALHSDEELVVVRYAAIDWQRRSSNAPRTLANWCLQICDAYERVKREIPEELLGWFVRPLVMIDVGGHVRLAFVQGLLDELDDVAPELRNHWPQADETVLVHAAGTVLRALKPGICSVDDAHVESVIRRATEPNRKRRFKTLRELRASLRDSASKEPIREGDELAAWRLFEEGAGWLALDSPDAALRCFDESLALAHTLPALEGRTIARKALSELPGPPVRQLESEPPRYTEADAQRLESQRAFVDALDIYRRLAPTKLVFVSRARCHLMLHEDGEAIDYAQRALAIDASDTEATWIVASAMLRRRWLDEALRNAERLVELEASGRSHYLRGKALFALGRMTAAHEAFIVATKLDPKLIEAQLLRREVERVTGNVRQSVGKQHAPTFDIPEQLADLRDVLISGDTNAAITALRDDRYAQDADAQLLLARLLAFDKRLDEAIAVYDQVAATSHRAAALVGKAAALLELGRAGDALSIVEQLLDDADAAELQARALDALGRVDEAADAYRRFIALASSGSNLRVRVAQLALEDIVARRRG